MISEYHELLIEMWSRIKPHVPAKERLEVADKMVVLFDEYGFIDETLLNEELDRELRAAAKSHLASQVEEEIDDDDYDSY